jgi:hypothetical protein
MLTGNHQNKNEKKAVTGQKINQAFHGVQFLHEKIKRIQYPEKK